MAVHLDQLDRHARFFERLSDGGFVQVDRVSRTSARGVYAAGDCTGVLMLASVAAMQGRIAMWHFLGDAVAPLDLKKVSSNVFTSPEIATVGLSQVQLEEAGTPFEVAMLPLAANPRAKMQGIRDGFVKLFASTATGIVLGGVVVSPRASELIHVVSLSVSSSLTVDHVADAFTIYPSMSGSIAEAARSGDVVVLRRQADDGSTVSLAGYRIGKVSDLHRDIGSVRKQFQKRSRLIRAVKYWRISASLMTPATGTIERRMPPLFWLMRDGEYRLAFWIAFAAGVTYLVIKITPAEKEKKPEPAAS